MRDDLEGLYDEFTDALAPEAAKEDAERFTPSTPEEYEWALRKRAALKAEADGWRERKAHEMALLASLFDRRVESAERGRAFFEEMIARGLGASEPDGRGRRRVVTVAGSAWMARRESWSWPAEDDSRYGALMAQAEEMGAVRRSLDKAALKARVKETGEALPGVEVEYHETLSIREA